MDRLARFSTYAILRVALALWLGLAGVTALMAQELPATLGDEIIAILKERPDVFRDTAEAAILGYGQGGQIDAEGIERMIAIRRAALRASQSRRLLVADLDNDGAIARAEVDALLPTLSASLRPRLLALHRGADADGDGIVGAVELRQFAQAHAERGFDADRAGELRRLLLADTDGDGRVSLDEVAQVIEVSRTGG